MNINKKIREYRTFRFSDGYDIPSTKTGVIATQKHFLSGGLKQDLRDKLSLDLGKIWNQHAFLFPSTAQAERYYTLMFILPEEAEDLAMHFSDLHTFQIEQIIKLLDNVVIAMHMKYPKVSKFYIVQHIAQREPYGHSFSQTLPQMHFHIFSYDEDELSSSDIFENTERFTDEEIYEQVYNVDETYIVKDWIDNDIPTIKLDEDQSYFTIYTMNIDDPDYQIEANIINKTFSSWKECWFNVTSCYTDFELTDDNRYMPISEQESENRIESLIQQTGPRFTRKSYDLLMDNIKIRQREFIQKDKYIYFKGINGTFGWEYDFSSNRKTCRLAPRHRIYLCDEFKNWQIIPDISHVVYKDREKMLAKDVREFLTAEKIAFNNYFETNFL